MSRETKIITIGIILLLVGGYICTEAVSEIGRRLEEERVKPDTTIIIKNGKPDTIITIKK